MRCFYRERQKRLMVTMFILRLAHEEETKLKCWLFSILPEWHLQQRAEMWLNSLFRNFYFMLMSKISWCSLSGRSDVYLIPDVPNNKTAFFSYQKRKMRTQNSPMTLAMLFWEDA